MNNIKSIIIILAVIISSNSCNKTEFQDDELSLEKQEYTGNQLRIDGYYYYAIDQNLFETYFFYENGVLISGGGNAPRTDPFEFIED